MENEQIQIKGVIRSFNSKLIDTKNGKRDSFSIEVEYPDGYGNYQVHKFSKFGKEVFSPGQIVQFCYEQNGNYKNIKGEVVVIVGENKPLVVEEKVLDKPVGGGSNFIDKQDQIMLGQAINLSWPSVSVPGLPTEEKLEIIADAYSLIKKANERILGK